MSKQLLFVDGIGGKRYMRNALVRHFESHGFQGRLRTRYRRSPACIWRPISAAPPMVVFGYGVIDPPDIRRALTRLANALARRQLKSGSRHSLRRTGFRTNRRNSAGGNWKQTSDGLGPCSPDCVQAHRVRRGYVLRHQVASRSQQEEVRRSPAALPGKPGRL